MDRNENCLAVLSKPSKVIDNVYGSLRVETGGWLVGEEDLGSCDELDCNLQYSAVIQYGLLIRYGGQVS